MKHLFCFCFLFICLTGVLAARQWTAPEGETLRYAVNWPSGLSLGEAELKAFRDGDLWRFSLGLEAAVPGFAIADRYSSAAGVDLCTVEFEKRISHGKESAGERATFHQASGAARRETIGGGASEFSIPACAKDALAFLFYLRRELAEGRLPPPQTVFFGAPYQISMEYGGRQKMVAGEQSFDCDRIMARAKGPASETSFEIFFAREPERRPVMFRLSLPLGSFSMELIP